MHEESPGTPDVEVLARAQQEKRVVVTFDKDFGELAFRLGALAGIGFTPRQREFLVTVMVHAGCFLERQYCAFTGTVRGQNSRAFMARLLARGRSRDGGTPSTGCGPSQISLTACRR